MNEHGAMNIYTWFVANWPNLNKKQTINKTKGSLACFDIIWPLNILRLDIFFVMNDFGILM